MARRGLISSVNYIMITLFYWCFETHCLYEQKRCHVIKIVNYLHRLQCDSWLSSIIFHCLCLYYVCGARGGQFTRAHNAPPPWIQCHVYFICGLGLLILLTWDVSTISLQRSSRRSWLINTDLEKDYHMKNGMIYLVIRCGHLEANVLSHRVAISNTTCWIISCCQSQI